MKKVFTTLLLTGLVLGASFATGFTQLDLAELLINKAKAEHLIENKDYTEEEIVTFITNYDLFEITDLAAGVEASQVRAALADYDTKKQSIASETDAPIDVKALNEEKQHEALESKVRVLSHEFMKTTWEERNFNDELGTFGPLDGESFITTDDDKYPLMNKYRYELYRIFGWYAKEYGLYVDVSPVSVGLYDDKASVVTQSTPLVLVEFDDTEFALPDGIHYSVRMKVGALYNIKYEGGDIEKYRKMRLDTGFKQAHLVMALKDASALFISDQIELNKFVDTYTADVVENEGKRYSYSKNRYETFADYKVFIHKIPGAVFYHLDYDLTKWGLSR